RASRNYERSIVLTRWNKIMATLQPTKDVERLTNERCDALLTPKNRDQMRSLLRDLCTPAVLRALAERWHVARLLDRTDLSYRDIHEAKGESTTSVVRVGRFLRDEPDRGYRLAVDAGEGGYALEASEVSCAQSAAYPCSALGTD